MKKIGCIHTFEDTEFLSRAMRTSVATLAVGLALGAAWCVLASFSSGSVPHFELPRVFADGGGIGWVVALVLGVAFPLALHELVHALFFKAFAPSGSTIGFGMNRELGMLYACAEGVVFTRRQYLVAVAAPTVVVTLLLVCIGALAAWPLWTLVVVFVHLSGCAGDWGYVHTICREPKVAYCEDTSWGVQFYAEDALGGRQSNEKGEGR